MGNPYRALQESRDAFEAEAAARQQARWASEVDRRITYIGDQRVFRNAAGEITYIGDQRVFRNAAGRITHIGDQRVFRNIS